MLCYWRTGVLCFECTLNKSNDNDSLKPNDSVVCFEFIKKLIFTNSWAAQWMLQAAQQFLKVVPTY